MAKGTPSGRSKDVRRARREIELRSLKELQQRVDSFVRILPMVPELTVEKGFGRRRQAFLAASPLLRHTTR